MSTVAFTAGAFAIGIARSLVASIFKHQAKHLKDSFAGPTLAKLGIIKPSFKANLEAAIAKGATKYFEKHPEQMVDGVKRFLSSEIVANAIESRIISGTPIDSNILLGRLADELDVPQRRLPSDWPNGIDPEVLLDSFFSAIHNSLAKTSDPGLLWIGARLAHIGEQIDELSSSVSKTRKNQISELEDFTRSQRHASWDKFENEYLSHLGRRFERLTTPGVREFRDLKQSLSVAYISLNLKSSGLTEPARAERFMADNDLIVIRGPAGSGKTTLLNWIIWNCARTSTESNIWKGNVPFFIPLRTVARTEVGSPTVDQFISYSVDRGTWAVAEPDGWLNSILRDQRRAIIMLDGVDELSRNRRAQFWDWVHSFIAQYPGNKIIITSRVLPRSTENDSEGRSNQWNPPPEFVDAQLDEMSTTDIARFIEHWHQSVIDATNDAGEKDALDTAKISLIAKLSDPINRRIRELCSTPLLCAMVCVLHWKEEGYLPRQRVELYDRCCEMLIEARDKKREIKVTSGALSSLTKNDKEAVLQKLAFQMMNNKPDESEEEGPDNTAYRIEISRDKAARWVEPWIKNFSQPETQSIKPNDLLDHLIERTGLLREPATNLIDYPHRTFQEYLAACAAGADGQEAFLAKQADDDQWHETIMLAAGTSTGGVPFGKDLIEALLRRAERHKSPRASSQRIKKTSIALALGCLENLRQQDATIRSRVLSFLNELVPPQNSLDARILSVAGDAAVPLLKYEEWKDKSTQTVAACAQALRLIGSTQSIASLKNGYISDARDQVIAEVSKVDTIGYDEVPLIAKEVSKYGVLPHYIAVSDIAQINGLNGLTHIRLRQPAPKNLELLSGISSLDYVYAEGQDLNLLAASIPKSVTNMHLMDCSGSKIDFIAQIPNISNLSMGRLADVEDYSVIGKLEALQSLRLFASPVENIDFVSTCSRLKNLTLQNLERLQNVSGAGEIEGLTEFACDFGRKLLNLSPLYRTSRVRMISLSSSGGELVESIPPNESLEKLSLVSISPFNQDYIYNFPALELLDVQQCVSVSDPIIFDNLSKLKTLSLYYMPVEVIGASIENSKIEEIDLGGIDGLRKSNLHRFPSSLQKISMSQVSGFKNVAGINHLRDLKYLDLSDCGVENLEGIGKLSSLRELRLRGCRRLYSLSGISDLIDLENLQIIGCDNITSISEISSCRSLKRLEILTRREEIDYSALKDLPNLEELTLLSVETRKYVLPENLLPKVTYAHVPAYYYLGRPDMVYYSSDGRGVVQRAYRTSRRRTSYE